jgi:AcrR family transcriptional regulator
MSARRTASRSGRRPGPTDTREAILDAARRAFAAGGYGATSLRGVARDAGVDPALVIHFFGSKAGLFIAAIGWPFDPAAEMDRVVAGRHEALGRNLAEMFVRHWEDEQDRSPIVAMLHVATGEPAGAEIMRTFLADNMLRPLVAAIGGDQPELRAGLIATQLLGMGVARYVLGYEPLRSLPVETVIALLADAIQRAIDQPLPGTATRDRSR